MKKKSEVRINPELNKYNDVVLFPKKVERAKQLLKDHPIPDMTAPK